jgi:hypothetical protein
MIAGLKWTVVVLGIVAFLLFLACAGLATPIELAFYFLVGWMFFLAKTLPSVQVNWPDVWIAIGASAIFVIGVHWFANWLFRSSVDGRSDRSGWAWRRSFAIGLVVIIAFAAGTAMVGIVHQITWMATSKERLVSSGEASYRHSSMNNSRQIVLALHNYNDALKSLPSGQTQDEHGIALHGWQYPLLPYLEEVNLYNAIDKTQPWNSGKNAEYFCQDVHCFLNPRLQRPNEGGSKQFSPSDYASNRLVIGPQAALKLSDVRDGTSNTLIGGEVVQNGRPWGSTNNWRDPRLGINKSTQGFGGPWNGGAAVMMMADGSTRYITDDIDPKVLEALATPDGGEDLKQLSPDW